MKDRNRNVIRNGKSEIETQETSKDLLRTTGRYRRRADFKLGATLRPNPTDEPVIAAGDDGESKWFAPISPRLREPVCYTPAFQQQCTLFLFSDILKLIIRFARFAGRMMPWNESVLICDSPNCFFAFDVTRSAE